jgi:predicted DNA-binding protein (UPF0278 family)
MLDIREAIKTLNEYSTSIVGKTRLCENVSNRGAPEEAKKDVEDFIAALEAETKDAYILAILVTREVNRHAEKLTAGFTGDLADLMTALNRNSEATEEAIKVTLAHQERNNPKTPTENPISKAIREFREKHRMN